MVSFDKKNTLNSFLKTNFFFLLVIDNHLTDYFNRADLQKVIHVSLDQGQSWTMCGGNDHYNAPNGGNVATELKKMVDSGQLKVILYNGDLDSVCNFVGDQM